LRGIVEKLIMQHETKLSAVRAGSGKINWVGYSQAFTGLELKEVI